MIKMDEEIVNERIRYHLPDSAGIDTAKRILIAFPWDIEYNWQENESYGLELFVEVWRNVNRKKEDTYANYILIPRSEGEHAGVHTLHGPRSSSKSDGASYYKMIGSGNPRFALVSAYVDPSFTSRYFEFQVRGAQHDGIDMDEILVHCDRWGYFSLLEGKLGLSAIAEHSGSREDAIERAQEVMKNHFLVAPDIKNLIIGGQNIPVYQAFNSTFIFYIYIYRIEK
jgi:hypothetical protein